MSFKRGLLGIGFASGCALLAACGGASKTPGEGGTGAVAGSDDGEAGKPDAQAGSGGSAAGSSSGGTSSGGSSSSAGHAGDDSNAGEAGAIDAGGSSGTAGSGGGTVGGSGGAGNAGAGGVASGGSGGAGPQATSSKLDVLFVVDNSVSMSDKQDVLESTLPAFVNRITNPLCVDDNHQPVANQPTSIAQACPSGKREFVANDVHIGVVSTSLGAHGGTVCATPVTADDTLDDKGELLGALRPGLTTWQNSGFLSWDPSGVSGSASPADITANLKATIVAAGDHGCGYEAPLEAMYRFLIDPEPPATVALVNNQTVRQGTDTQLLSERAAFLRPDSAVAVLLLSDENDCSIQDSGLGWFVGATSHMPKATAACALNPNDACCRSCAQNETAPPAGCLALSVDPICMGAAAGTYNTWDNLNDSLNLRCFDQKQRFGFDLLYPTSRYVSGLSALTITNNEGASVKNPLFFDSTGTQTRSPTLVTAAVMVGVPWQDLATSASISGGKLEYLDAAGLTAQGRWPMLLGNPETFVAPTDPFMVESILPRSGSNPLTGAVIAPATSQDPTQNAINGHEQNVVDNDDLQYACIFKLPAAKVCQPGDSGCDCSAGKDGDTTDVVTYNSPVCQPPTGGPASTTQYYAKAYPGLRELSVVHALSDRGVPTSICPKTLDVTDSQYGYAPAFDALLKRVSLDLK